MSMTRFATLCDQCGRRSEEYTHWPKCIACMDDVCTDCHIDKEIDERNETLCKRCARETS